LHNNITHKSGPTSILDSLRALHVMQSSLQQILENNEWVSTPEVALQKDSRHGKEVVLVRLQSYWEPPLLVGQKLILMTLLCLNQV
jgi:hypothetical protein